jgi:hypothetical protein
VTAGSPSKVHPSPQRGPLDIWSSPPDELVYILHTTASRCNIIWQAGGTHVCSWGRGLALVRVRVKGWVGGRWGWVQDDCSPSSGSPLDAEDGELPQPKNRRKMRSTDGAPEASHTPSNL